MEYKVVKDFTDLNSGHVYRAGDSFPRFGVEVDDARITELSTTGNRRGEILIEAVKEKEVDFAEAEDVAVAKEEIAPEKKRKKRHARADIESA